jgi:hypothetical protein
MSLGAGLISTGVMTIIEIPFWKKWGITGILEWHENQILSSKYFRFSHPDSFLGILSLHFLNGSIGGFGLLLGLILIPYLINIHFLILGSIYGVFLWVFTLIPIHKSITEINPFRHPLGIGPVIVSFIGHIFYGIMLISLFRVLFLTTQ